MREALSARELAAWQTRCRAALEARAALLGTEEGGSETLAALPWLAEAPIVAVARAAFELEHVVPPLISPQWRSAMEVAARRLAHYLSPDAAAAAALDLARGDWAEYLSEPPRSLGAIAVCMARVANEHRAIARDRAGKRKVPLRDRPNFRRPRPWAVAHRAEHTRGGLA